MVLSLGRLETDGSISSGRKSFQTGVQPIRRHGSSSSISDSIWICSECSQRFVKSKDLEAHARRSGHKAYQCFEDECGKVFGRRTAFIRHKAVHSHSKQHICSSCGKAFHRRDHCAEHEEICQDEAKFSRRSSVFDSTSGAAYSGWEETAAHDAVAPDLALSHFFLSSENGRAKEVSQHFQPFDALLHAAEVLDSTSSNHSGSQDFFSELSGSLLPEGSHSIENVASGPTGFASRNKLCQAAESDDLETMQALLDHDWDVNATDSAGWTPLHHAAFRANARCAQLLLDHGANINARTNAEETASELIMGHERAHNVFELLLLRGADETTDPYPIPESRLRETALEGELGWTGGYLDLETDLGRASPEPFRFDPSGISINDCSTQSSSALPSMDHRPAWTEPPSCTGTSRQNRLAVSFSHLCDSCGGGYTHARDLRRHQTRTGHLPNRKERHVSTPDRRPHSSIACHGSQTQEPPKAITRKTATSHTSREIFSCDKCHVTCSRSSDLARHKDRMHEPKRFHCTVPGCSHMNRRRDKAVQHYRTIHKDGREEDFIKQI